MYNKCGESNLVTIIVPVYNVEKYLERCLNSIIKQSYSNLEIILIDDGSTDNSGKICDEFQNIDKRIHTIHKKNGGLSSARNTGMDKAHGIYITFIDSDDWIDERFIELMVSEMENTGSDIVQCGYKRINSSGKITYETNLKKQYLVTKKDILDAFFITGNFQTMACAKLYKNSFINDYRFMVGKNNEDTILMADIMDDLSQISIIHNNLYNYFYNPESITNTRLNTTKIEQAYYSAYYMLKKCENNYPDYAPYMLFNICLVSVSLYNLAEKDQRKYKKWIKENFRKSYSQIDLKKIGRRKIDKIRITFFYVSPEITVKLYRKLCRLLRRQ